MFDSIDKGMPLMTPTFFDDNDPNNPKRKTYIERKALVKKIKDKAATLKLFQSLYTSQSARAFECLAEEIAELPAADVVEVRHGYWGFNRGQAYGEPLYFCSLCVDGSSDNGRDNYCPNCGAKMDGKDVNNVEQ